MSMKRIPIGYEDFKQLIENDLYFTDKSLMIREKNWTIAGSLKDWPSWTMKKTAKTTLKLLSSCLYQFHGREVVVLIDEYDVPLENAYFEGFYDGMIGFIRSLFESVLKTNLYLKMGVVTGCLRISREHLYGTVQPGDSFQQRERNRQAGYHFDRAEIHGKSHGSGTKNSGKFCRDGT